MTDNDFLTASAPRHISKVDAGQIEAHERGVDSWWVVRWPDKAPTFLKHCHLELMRFNMTIQPVSLEHGFERVRWAEVKK